MELARWAWDRGLDEALDFAQISEVLEILETFQVEAWDLREVESVDTDVCFASAVYCRDVHTLLTDGKNEIRIKNELERNEIYAKRR
jgi:hypothetical protein